MKMFYFTRTVHFGAQNMNLTLAQFKSHAVFVSISWFLFVLGKTYRIQRTNLKQGLRKTKIKAIALHPKGMSVKETAKNKIKF